MYKRFGVALGLAILLLSLVSPTFMGSSKVSAWGPAPAESCVGFDWNWQWKAKIKEHSSIAVSGSPAYGPMDVDLYTSNGSMIIYRTSSMAPNQIIVGLADGPDHRSRFLKDTDGYYKFVQRQDKTVYDSSTQIRLDSNAKTATVIGATPPHDTSADTKVFDVACIFAAKGFTYDSTWNTTQFNTVIPSEGETKCDPRNIACHVAKWFSGISDTLISANKALFGGLMSIFIPDMEDLSEIFTSTYQLIGQKLGFLGYPLEFVKDLFQEVIDYGNNNCTETFCQKTFPPFMGQSVTINFALMHTVAPSLWQFILYMVRVMMTVSVIIMFFNKWKAIVR